MKTLERPKNLNDRHRLGAKLLREHNQEKENALRKERMRIKKEKTEYNKPENRKARREELRKAKRKSLAVLSKLAVAMSLVIACLIAVPDAQAGPLCNRLGGCGAGQVQAPVQKGERVLRERRPARNLLRMVFGR